MASSSLSLQKESSLRSLAEWHSSLDPLRVDIVCDFAGNDLVDIHGESSSHTACPMQGWTSKVRVSEVSSMYRCLLWLLSRWFPVASWGSCHRDVSLQTQGAGL